VSRPSAAALARTSWIDWADHECRRIEAAGQWRSRCEVPAEGVVSFASNDYLGLSRHRSVEAAAHEAIDRWGTGSGSARLVVGSRPVHHRLEAELAAWRGCDGALLFPTGYAANLGVLTTFGTSGVRICSDELNHASIVDGCRLARADVAVYRHLDLAHLARLLDGAARAIVVTDTVFSMDGDEAPVDDLVELCAHHGALLVLDEAHAVLGPHPSFSSALSSAAGSGVDVVRVGTLSKTLGSLGGFAAGSRRIVELLVNRARSFIFTTASAPADTAAALAALRVLRSAEGDMLVDRLRANVQRLSPGRRTPIIPVLVGDERDALAASAALLDRGLLVPAIRPPTVAPGTSRLRVAVSATHTADQLDALRATLDDLALEPAPGSGGL
jgi:8-amino-7-oxononanoate synthase